jgi:hypothetical protein
MFHFYFPGSKNENGNFRYREMTPFPRSGGKPNLGQQKNASVLAERFYSTGGIFGSIINPSPQRLGL